MTVPGVSPPRDLPLLPLQPAGPPLGQRRARLGQHRPGQVIGQGQADDRVNRPGVDSPMKERDLHRLAGGVFALSTTDHDEVAFLAQSLGGARQVRLGSLASGVSRRLF